MSSHFPSPVTLDLGMLLLLCKGGFRPKAQTANPAPAANKKPIVKVSSGKLFLDGQHHSDPERAADAQADETGPLPFASLPCR
jgi:hypothetical protein